MTAPPARRGHGYRVAEVDAAETKVRCWSTAFHAVARQMPEETARAFLARTIAESGYQLPSDPTNLTLAAVADANDMPERRLHTSITDILWRDLFRDYAMSQEFRLAMVRLCRAQLSRRRAGRHRGRWPGCAASSVGSPRSSAP